MTDQNTRSKTHPFKLLRSYVFWTYERGSLHYDVMVTLILLFLFISPHVIDFHDRPIPEVPRRSSEVLVRDAGSSTAGHQFVYEIRADDLDGAHTDAERGVGIDRIVHNIAADGQIESIKPVVDPHKRIVAYAVQVRR